MQAGRGAPPPAPPVRQSGGALAVFPSTLIKKRPSDWTAAFDMADSVLPTTAPGRLGETARRKTTPVPGVRAPCARARQSRAVFRLPVGVARHAKAAVPTRAHFRYGSGNSRAEALRPRRGGRRDAVGSSADPWQGAADFGRRTTGGGVGVKGAQPPAASFPHFLSGQEMGPPAGARPGNSAAH